MCAVGSGNMYKSCQAIQVRSLKDCSMLAVDFGCLMIRFVGYCIVLIALSHCNRVFTRRLRLCHSHTVYRRVVRKGGREGPNRVESEV